LCRRRHKRQHDASLLLSQGQSLKAVSQCIDLMQVKTCMLLAPWQVVQATVRLQNSHDNHNSLEMKKGHNLFWMRPLRRVGVTGFEPVTPTMSMFPRLLGLPSAVVRQRPKALSVMEMRHIINSPTFALVRCCMPHWRYIGGRKAPGPIGVLARRPGQSLTQDRAGRNGAEALNQPRRRPGTQTCDHPQTRRRVAVSGGSSATLKRTTTR
jgi:hypothetical protein